MKGIQGLILALGLGIAGALVNWAYLASRSKEVEAVEFVAIAPNASLNRGDVIREDQITRLAIPTAAVGNLRDFAVLYSARQTVIGRPVWRVKLNGALLLNDDLRTPPPELVFNESPSADGEEVAMFISLNSVVVTQLLEPGDMVSFATNVTHYNRPTVAAKPAEVGSDPKDLKAVPVVTPAVASSDTEIIGPFKILSLGTRLGSLDVMRANKMASANENVLTISVKIVDGVMEPKAQKLLHIVETSNAHLTAMLHGRKKK